MIEKISILAAAVALIVILTNIITQVVKGFTYDKIPTRVVAVLVAVTLSVAGILVWCAVTGVTVTWYIIFGALVGGFIAAYGAMYGYDNLCKELWEAVKALWQRKQTKG